MPNQTPNTPVAGLRGPRDYRPEITTSNGLPFSLDSHWLAGSVDPAVSPRERRHFHSPRS
jgi:hypothetical protein